VRLGTVIDDDIARQPYADTLADGTPPPPGLQCLGGAVSRVPGNATAYPHRQAELMFVTTSAGPRPALEAVKRQFDPGNLFARNHNIRPH
jgi:hypothetical protein